jgi:hypothetical protein
VCTTRNDLRRLGSGPEGPDPELYFCSAVPSIVREPI